MNAPQPQPAVWRALSRDYTDIVRIYQGSDGEATRALYRALEQFGPVGGIAVNAPANVRNAPSCIAAAAATKPRPMIARTGASATSRRALHSAPAAEVASGVVWGWAIDDALRAKGDPHHHILYIELSTGQVSFHTGSRGPGADYAGQWDGARGVAAERICRWVAVVMAQQRCGASGAALDRQQAAASA